MRLDDREPYETKGAALNILNILAKFTDIGAHYRRPDRLIGHIVGDNMAQQHIRENNWTVSLLDVQPTDFVLEIGFGPGIAIQRLAALTPQAHISGIDFSPTMVRAASKRNARSIKMGHIDLHCGDVVTLPFADSSFDKIFSLHSIYFWPQPVRAMQEIYRVLKPEGTLIMTILPKEKWSNEGADAPLCNVYSGETLSQLMRNNGFTDTRIAYPEPTSGIREIAVIAKK